MEPRMVEETEIDLFELFGVLMKRIWIIILAAVIFGAAFFGYTLVMIDPLYKSRALMYVNNSDISIGSTSVSISSGQLTAAQKLVDTYLVILNSRTTLNDVIEEAGLDYSYTELKSMISSAAVNNTEIFEIVVTSTDPNEAEENANTIAKVLPSKIAAIVAGSDVRIVDYAVIPAHRSSPSYTRNTALGALLGAFLCAGYFTVIFIFDDNIHSEDYLTNTYTDIPLLAVVPDMNVASKQKVYYSYRTPDRKIVGSAQAGLKSPSASKIKSEGGAEL